MAEVQPAAGQGPMTTKVTARRFRLKSPARATAMTLCVLVLVLLAAYVPLCAAARQLTASEVWADSSALVVAVVGRISSHLVT